MRCETSTPWCQYGLVGLQLENLTMASSRRVKLNRVALKDVLQIKLMPRRRQLKPLNDVVIKQEEKHVVSEIMSVKDAAIDEQVQTFLTEKACPDSQSVPDSATKRQPRMTAVSRSYRKRDVDIKQEVPLISRGKKHREQERVGTHSGDSESAPVKPSVVHCWVNQRGNIPEMSSEVHLAIISNDTNNRTTPKYVAGKLRGDREGQSSSVKARSADSDPQLVGTERTGTGSTPTGLSSKAHFAVSLFKLG